MQENKTGQQEKPAPSEDNQPKVKNQDGGNTKEQPATEDKWEGFGITKKAVEKAKAAAKEKGVNLMDNEKTINHLYDIYRKEFLRKAVVDALGLAGENGKVPNEVLMKYKMEGKDIGGNIKFETFKNRLEKIIGGESDESEEIVDEEWEDGLTDNWGDSWFEEENEKDVDSWMDNIISRVQNNEPIVQKTETSSVMYPDVVDSEPEPDVAPAIPHFEKISHADKDGFTRADDQWIDSKMTLLRKRGII